MRLLALALALLFAFGESAKAFCGFYVARADTTMLNHASKVVLARNGDRTVLAMCAATQKSSRSSYRSRR